MSTDAPHAPSRVLPRFPELDTEQFWTAAKSRQLTYPFCERCSTVVFYPRRHCTNCTNTELVWRTSAGTGTIYTFSVVRRTQHPAFVALAPYVIAWVDVDEGFRILTHIVGVDPDDRETLAIGRRVEVEWLEVEDAVLPAFRIV